MPNRDTPQILVSANIAGMDKLLLRMSTGLSVIAAVKDVLDDHAKILQKRAVRNVSGHAVTFEGKTFVINRQTGNLARLIQIADAGPLALRVVASAKYSGDVELGTRGPVDLKKTALAGKIVPIPVSNSQGKLLSSPTGAAIKSIFVGRFTSKQIVKGKTWASTGFKANTQIASTGKVMGSKYIMFRRVPGPGGKGWIIPQRAGRPFMAEAAAYTLPLLTTAVAEAFASYLDGTET